MRVIAGRCGGLRLKAPKGRRVRPTADRAKETLFNVIGPELPGARVLDLFAGSGALGIEALSRGAESAVFVEQHGGVAAALRDNLRHCRLEEAARVVVAPWRRALGRLEGPFDVILADPPWDQGGGEAALVALAGAGQVRDGALGVLEHPADREPAVPVAWRVTRRLDVGGTAFTLFRWSAADTGVGGDEDETEAAGPPV